MPTEHIKSVSGFVADLEERLFTQRHGSWIFRGHSKQSYKLIPSVGRVAYTASSFEKFEKSILNLFKRNSIKYVSRNLDNDFEWLALAQHHGLPTRLLDWTYNPLAALYFCVKSNEEEDGEIICLNAEKRMNHQKYIAGKPFEIDKACKFVPNSIADRLTAQEGLFTIHCRPSEPLDKELRSDWTIQRFCVEASVKKNLRYSLFRLGAHEACLFPDIDGLSRHLHWRHTVDPLPEGGFLDAHD